MQSERNGEQLWVWWANHPRAGWTQISAVLPGIGHVLLSHRSRSVAERWRAYAIDHANSHGQEVRLARMVAVETVERHAPRPQG